MHELGRIGVAGLGDDYNSSTWRAPSSGAPSSGITKTKVLADMVTDGMRIRNAKRMSQMEPGTANEGKPTRSRMPWHHRSGRTVTRTPSVPHEPKQCELPLLPSTSVPSSTGTGLARLTERLKGASNSNHSKSLSSLSALRHVGKPGAAQTPDRNHTNKKAHGEHASLTRNGSFNNTMSSRQRQDIEETRLLQRGQHRLHEQSRIRASSSSSSSSGASSPRDAVLNTEEEAKLEKQVTKILARHAAGDDVHLPKTYCFKGSGRYRPAAETSLSQAGHVTKNRSNIPQY